MPRAKMILEENKVYVLQAPPNVHSFIDRATRFKAHGFERSEKYKAGKWDGFTRLYDWKEKSFPIGLLETVEMMLILKDIDYQIIDDRVFKQFKKIPIKHNIELRDYQETAVEKAIERKRGLIQLPTGAGKTLVGIYLTAALRVPTVFYVHKKELLYQTLRSYRKSLIFLHCDDCSSKKKKKTGKCDSKKCPIGLVGDGHLNIKPITIAMVQSANRLPHQLFSNFGIAIVDECHHIPSQTVYDITIHTKSEYVIGLSATIRRQDGRELMIQAGAGPILCNISISDLIREGYLAKPHIHSIRVPPLMFGRRDNYQTVYKKAIVYNTDRNDSIAVKAVELSNYGPVYIHVKMIDHGDILTNLINKKLLVKGQTKAVFIHGSDKSSYRNKILDKFRNDEQPILVSTLLGEGVDLPNMYALVLASGGLSKTMIIQTLGRLLRISNHGIVEFYDVADQCKYLYDHFLNRVSFYQSEEEFELEEFLRNVKTE